MAGVLVFTEIKDGKLKKASREALSIGRKLAEAAGGDLVAFASDAAAAASFANAIKSPPAASASLRPIDSASREAFFSFPSLISVNTRTPGIEVS